MTPKEKAIELVHKYNNNDHLYYSITIEQAKNCALIAVDEIIEELEATNSTKLGGFFWLEVKQEIEKL